MSLGKETESTRNEWLNKLTLSFGFSPLECVEIEQLLK